jgi:ATP-dependent Clp protease adaptor protein ClpS
MSRPTQSFVQISGPVTPEVIDRPPEVLKPGAVAANKPEVREPPMYDVTLHNDDTTPYDYVVASLQKFFNLQGERAQRTMWEAHKSGRAHVVTLPKDVAETKVGLAIAHARGTQHPEFRDQTMKLTYSATPNK